MLEYAMATLTMIGLAMAFFSFELYMRRREPRHLYFLGLGWLIFAVSPLFNIATVRSSASLAHEFEITHMVGFALVVLGVYSYFMKLPERKMAFIVLGTAVALWALDTMHVVSLEYTLALVLLLMLATSIYAVTHWREFRRIGGTSVYSFGLLAIVGFATVANWMRYYPIDPAHIPMDAWLGTTALTVCAALFIVQFEQSYTVLKLTERETELRRYHDELERLVDERTAELSRANRAKSDFLAAMSHELRTPLNAVLGFSGVLQREFAGPLNEEQLRQVGMIRESGERLLELVDHVLDLERVEAGGVELKPRVFSVREAAESAVNVVRLLAEERGLELTTRVDDRCDTMCTDRMRLDQILLNLLGNAVKFTPEGSVVLDVRCEGNMLAFTVRDTGVGIASDDRAHIFDEFYQVRPLAGGKSVGAGLGLAVSVRLAALLGGDIEVESIEGRGSEFTLRLRKDLDCGDPAADDPLTERTDSAE